MQLGEMQHFNNTPLGEMQSGEMQLSREKHYFFFFFFFFFLISGVYRPNQ